MSAIESSPADTAIDPALRRLAIVMLTGAVMPLLDSTIVNVAVRTLGAEFGTSLATIQWVLTGYMLALSMTIPLAAWVVARFGTRTTWLFSLGAFIAGSVLCGLAWDVGSLIAFRILQGVGGGLIMPVGQTMLAQAAGPRRMGRLMAVVGAPAMLAPVLGPVIGGLIVDHVSWRWLFFVNVPLCAAAIGFALRWLPHGAERQRGSRLDALGLVLLSPGIAALLYGLSEAGNGAAFTSAAVLGTVGAGALLAVAFTVHALRKRDGALLDLRLFRHRPFTGGTVAMFVYSGSMFGMIILVPLYYQLAHGDGPLRAGLMTAPFGLGAMVTMIVGGRLADRRGPRAIILTGIAVVTLSTLVFTQLEPGTSRALLLTATFTSGLGHGLTIAPLMAAIYYGLPREAAGSATATIGILARIGGAVGTALLAILLQIYIRAQFPGTDGSLDQVSAAPGTRAAEGLVTAFGQSFWWTAALAGIALFPALLLPRGKPDH